MARVGLQPFVLNINLPQQLTFTSVGSQGTHLVFVDCFFLYIDVWIYAVNTIVAKGNIHSSQQLSTGNDVGLL